METSSVIGGERSKPLCLNSSILSKVVECSCRYYTYTPVMTSSHTNTGEYIRHYCTMGGAPYFRLRQGHVRQKGVTSCNAYTRWAKLGNGRTFMHGLSFVRLRYTTIVPPHNTTTKTSYTTPCTVPHIYTPLWLPFKNNRATWQV